MMKIAIAGDGLTGTVSICRCFTAGEFSQDHYPGHGKTWMSTTIKTSVHNEPIKVLMFPRPRYHAFPDQYQMRGWFRGTKGLILVYDITRKISFELLPRWLDEALQYSSNFPVAIVGNKADLKGKDTEDRRQYYASEDTIDPRTGLLLAESISDEYNVPTLFIETSAKTGENIHCLFSEFIEMVVDHHRRGD